MRRHTAASHLGLQCLLRSVWPSMFVNYKGVSINNQPIPFPMDRDGHDFHALFQYMLYTWIQNCTRIESFFNNECQIYSDRRIQVEQIHVTQALGISHGRVSTILHDRLGMRKLIAGWVPKSLSNEQMATRASVCNTLVKRFRSKDDFLLRLVTVDET